MNAQQPTMSFIGDLNGALAAQVLPHVRLESSTVSLAARHSGVLIDGATAPSLDQQTLSQLLGSSDFVALCNPTVEHLGLLGKITGQTPSADVAMVSFRKTNSDPPRYKCSVVPRGLVNMQMRSDSDVPTKTTVPYIPDVGQILAEAVQNNSSLGITPTGLVPPQGTYCGYRSSQIQGNWNLGYPEWNNGPWDDNTAKDTSQSLNYLYLNEFFVYWVNGGTMPYYLVIQRQTGPVSIGNVLANSQDSSGFFNLAWHVLPNTVSVGGVTNPSGVQPGPYAPKSAENGLIPVDLAVEMTLWGRTQTGVGPVQFTAYVQDSLNYPDWGVVDQTQGIETAWEGYQTQGWNPLQNPTWQQLYTDGNVVTMSDQSFGAIDFETLTCWTFGSPLISAQSSAPPFTPPPSLSVTFNYGYEQDMAFLHNHPGCSGNYSGHHFHIWDSDLTLTSSTTLDLGQVVMDQGFIPS